MEDYSYPLVLADSFVITQQISIVVIFVAIFMLTLNDIITVNMLGIVDIVTALGGYLIWAICRTLQNQPVFCHRSSASDLVRFLSYHAPQKPLHH